MALPIRPTIGPVRSRWVGAAAGLWIADAGHVAFIGGRADYRRSSHARPVAAGADVGTEVGTRQAEFVVVPWLLGARAIGLADATTARTVEEAAIDARAGRTDPVLATVADGAAVVVSVAAGAVGLGLGDAPSIGADLVVAGVAISTTRAVLGPRVGAFPRVRIALASEVAGVARGAGVDAAVGAGDLPLRAGGAALALRVADQPLAAGIPAGTAPRAVVATGQADPASVADEAVIATIVGAAQLFITATRDAEPTLVADEAVIATVGIATDFLRAATRHTAFGLSRAADSAGQPVAAFLVPFAGMPLLATRRLGRLLAPVIAPALALAPAAAFTAYRFPPAATVAIGSAIAATFSLVALVLARPLPLGPALATVSRSVQPGQERGDETGEQRGQRAAPCRGAVERADQSIEAVWVHRVPLSEWLTKALARAPFVRPLAGSSPTLIPPVSEPPRHRVMASRGGGPSASPSCTRPGWAPAPNLRGYPIAAVRQSVPARAAGSR